MVLFLALMSCQNDSIQEDIPVENLEQESINSENDQLALDFFNMINENQNQSKFIVVTSLDIGIRKRGIGSYQSISRSCLRSNTDYEILVMVPSSKSCACFSILQNGSFGMGSVGQQCRDTRPVSFQDFTIPIGVFNYATFNLRTNSFGNFNFQAFAGCGGSSIATTYGASRTVNLAIQNSQACH